MSYKQRAKEQGEQVEEQKEAQMACVRCHDATKVTLLAMFGGMCKQCFSDYCQKPFPIPRRKEAA